MEKVEMLYSSEYRWDIRPKDDGWCSYRIYEASDAPFHNENFVHWPIDAEGQREFITLDDSSVIELLHQDGRQTMYAHRRNVPQIEYSFSIKGAKALHCIRIKGLSFRIHRRRIWLEDKKDRKYFLGKIAEGETVYVTECLEYYTLAMDQVCSVLTSKSRQM